MKNENLETVYNRNGTKSYNCGNSLTFISIDS